MTRDHAFGITVPNRLSSIAAVNDRFNAFANEIGLADAVRRRINMAFDELLNNVISYGFEDEAVHDIEVRVSLEGERLVIAIEDDGRPFNPCDRAAPDTTLPLEDRPVGGLGIHLVRNAVDDVTYERRRDRNVVRLVKQLDEA